MSKEKAVDYFDRHPSSNECHITSDGRVFHTIGSAQGFANGLKDNKIESYKRSDSDVKNIEVNDSIEETGENNKEALKAFDSATAQYEEGKALAKALGIETPSNSKADIFAALDAAKANLEPKE
jgi:hypothetical protein